MKVQHLLMAAACFATATPACFAQFNSDNIDIGPDGIHVHAGGQQVEIGGQGIQVKTNTGTHVNLGNARGGSIVSGSSARNNVRVGGTVNGTASGTATLSLAQQVSLIEQQTVGRTSDGTPLAMRVAKLEKDNIGHAGVGPLHDRIQVLVRELGVKMPGATPVVTDAVVMSAPQTSSSNQVSITSTNTGTELRGNGGNATVSGSNKPVMLQGSGNNVTITGGTPTLYLKGTGNAVFVEEVDTINILGSGNHVVWKKGFHNERPALNDEGSGNNVAQGSSL